MSKKQLPAPDTLTAPPSKVGLAVGGSLMALLAFPLYLEFSAKIVFPNAADDEVIERFIAFVRTFYELIAYRGNLEYMVASVGVLGILFTIFSSPLQPNFMPGFSKSLDDQIKTLEHMYSVVTFLIGTALFTGSVAALAISPQISETKTIVLTRIDLPLAGLLGSTSHYDRIIFLFLGLALIIGLSLRSNLHKNLLIRSHILVLEKKSSQIEKQKSSEIQLALSGHAEAQNIKQTLGETIEQERHTRKTYEIFTLGRSLLFALTQTSIIISLNLLTVLLFSRILGEGWGFVPLRPTLVCSSLTFLCIAIFTTSSNLVSSDPSARTWTRVCIQLVTGCFSTTLFLIFFLLSTQFAAFNAERPISIMFISTFLSTCAWWVTVRVRLKKYGLLTWWTLALAGASFIFFVIYLWLDPVFKSPNLLPAVAGPALVFPFMLFFDKRATEKITSHSNLLMTLVQVRNFAVHGHSAPVHNATGENKPDETNPLKWKTIRPHLFLSTKYLGLQWKAQGLRNLEWQLQETRAEIADKKEQLRSADEESNSYTEYQTDPSDQENDRASILQITWPEREP